MAKSSILITLTFAAMALATPDPDAAAPPAPGVDLPALATGCATPPHRAG